MEFKWLRTLIAEHAADPTDYVNACIAFGIQPTLRFIEKTYTFENVYTFRGTSSTTTIITIGGRSHRRDGPAFTLKSDNSSTSNWWFKGKRHRDDGNEALYDECRFRGDVYLERGWYVNGELHRIDGPAHIKTQNGVVVLEQWYNNGVAVYPRTKRPRRECTAKIKGFYTRYYK